MPHVKYFWDEMEDNAVREYDEDNNTVASYTTEPTLYGSVLTQDRGSEVRHFHFDGQGNTTELTAESGIVTVSRRYSATGITTVTLGADTFPYQFAGRYGYVTFVTFAGISVRPRVLKPDIARWMSQDPLLFVADINLYRNVRNQWTLRADPSGRWDADSNDNTAPTMQIALTAGEKSAMSGCACEEIATLTKEKFKKAPNTYAYVVCQNKSLAIVINNWNGIMKETIKALEECELKQCIILHESVHIAQINDACVGFCMGCGIIGEVSIGFETKACSTAAECDAYKREARCALDQVAKNVKTASKKACAGSSLSYLKSIRESLVKFCNQKGIAPLLTEIDDATNKLKLQKGF